MTGATLGQRFQIVIPRREREKLHLKPNTKIFVEARDGYIAVMPAGSGVYRGIGKDLADRTDASSYIRKLRAEWNARK